MGMDFIPAVPDMFARSAAPPWRRRCRVEKIALLALTGG
jgi:hypothetical protein